MIRGGKEDKLSMHDMFAQFPSLSNLFKQGFSLIPVGLPGGGCLFIFLNKICSIILLRV